MKTTITGRGVPVWGTDLIDVYTDSPEWTGAMVDLFEPLTGEDLVHINAVHAFKEFHNPVRENYRAFYRERHTREYPPLYRYTISVELEEITDPEEIAEFWKNQE